MNNQKVAKINWNGLKENHVSKRLYAIMLKWAGFANRHYREWSGRENCGHYFGGAYVYETESVFSAAVMAILSVLGEYDESMTGLPREEIKRRAIGTIRYLCYTHTSGPDDCVRDKGRYEAYNGKKWGFVYDNFFRDSQTGVGTAAIGLAAWLLWDELDEETCKLVKNLLFSYADKFSDMMPGTGVYNDTQCEENAWTSLGISAALYMFPDHPNSEKWLGGYIRWSLNSVVTYKDKLEKEWDKVTYTSRGGVEHKGKLYGISSVTFHPDYTTENHGYVHPDYMAAGIVLRGASAVFPLLLGKEPLESCTFNFKELYEKALKPICSMDGNTLAAQGQDWFYHKHHNKLMIHASMNLLFGDPDAAFFENGCIEIIEARQDSIGTGGLMEKNGDELDIAPGVKSAFDMESPSVRTIMLPYLMHLARGIGAKSSTVQEVGKKLSGNHFFPYGGVYIHRTPESFTSFTTRCSVMGLSMPLNGLWDITTDFMGMTGYIKAKNENDGYFRNKMINWMDLGLETRNLKVIDYKDGFSIYADIPRAMEKLTQSVSFTALPDGKSVYMERITANEEIEITAMDTGRVSIGNENFSKLGDLAKGSRRVWFNELEQIFPGSYSGENEIFRYSNVKYVNVDNKMGYLVFGENDVEYINMHKFHKWKGLENILICSKGRTGIMTKGESKSVFAMISIPNATRERTQNEFNETKVTHSSEASLVIRNKEHRVAANFNKHSMEIHETISGPVGEVIIFPGKTTLESERVSCGFEIGGEGTTVNQSVMKMLFDEVPGRAKLEVLCTEAGKVWINNTGETEISYRTVKDESSETINHKHGKMIEI